MPYLILFPILNSGISEIIFSNYPIAFLPYRKYTSNVIIIRNAEKNQGVTLTFWDFVKVGVPLTLMNIAVYWLFLSLATG
ncbi:MAG: hypothetical protein AABZ77_03690 [Chloroflexota bacterium]